MSTISMNSVFPLNNIMFLSACGINRYAKPYIPCAYVRMDTSSKVTQENNASNASKESNEDEEFMMQLIPRNLF